MRLFDTHTHLQFSEFDNVAASYAVPLTVHDTTLRVHGSQEDFAVIEEPFDSLDITSESYRAGATLRQPLYQTANRELALAVTFERRRSKTFLLGQAFDVAPGSVDGVTEISALRLAQEWSDRRQNQVLALRSTFSVGIDALGVTDDGSGRDAKFFAWLGQAQYVRRVFDTPNQLVLRTDAQLTDQPLLSLEQFPVGGAFSVRGYRENQLVRDRGVVSSIELRVPVLLSRGGLAVVQLAPFFDFGGGWNNRSSTPQPRTIASAGVGVLLSPNRHITGQLYWGYPFRRINADGDDPQDLGLHFSLTLDLF
jgi:hemolysin activation/secretion protein